MKIKSTFFHLIIIILLIGVSSIFASNIFEERIFNLINVKRSIYVNKGIFHHLGTSQSDTLLNDVRSSSLKSRDYERIVLDFKTKSIPKAYGSIDAANGKIYLDLFNTELNPKLVRENKKYKKISSIDFFKVDNERLTAEFILKNKSMNAEIFFLENPGRIVIDIK